MDYWPIERNERLPIHKQYETFNFSSNEKRKSFLADKIIGSREEKVFLIVGFVNGMKDGDEHVYVFDNWYEVDKALTVKYSEVSLFEFSNFKDAYDEALCIKKGK